jgi:hypothetical protein
MKKRMSADDLERLFVSRGALPRAGELFFAVPLALDFVQACEENHLTVLGIEGYDLDRTTDKLTPDLSLIYDASLVPKQLRDHHEVNNSASDFISHAPPRSSLLFSFTVEESA